MFFSFVHGGAFLLLSEEFPGVLGWGFYPLHVDSFSNVNNIQTVGTTGSFERFLQPLADLPY